MKDIVVACVMLLGLAFLLVVVFCLMGWIVTFCWNGVIVYIFGCKSIEWVHGMMIYLLAQVLVSPIYSDKKK